MPAELERVLTDIYTMQDNIGQIRTDVNAVQDRIYYAEQRLNNAEQRATADDPVTAHHLEFLLNSVSNLETELDELKEEVYMNGKNTSFVKIGDQIININHIVKINSKTLDGESIPYLVIRLTNTEFSIKSQSEEQFKQRYDKLLNIISSNFKILDIDSEE